MVIKALAAQSIGSPADTVRRFISTSSAYLELAAVHHPGRTNRQADSEFIDPAPYRSILQAPAKRIGR